MRHNSMTSQIGSFREMTYSNYEFVLTGVLKKKVKYLHWTLQMSWILQHDQSTNKTASHGAPVTRTKM